MGLPVMVYIHGGVGVGSGSSYPGHYLAMHGSVLVVTINYRLGALGFLTTYDQESPGNYGLWDQNQALRWLQQNVAQFGGDPGRVTVFGQQNGGAAASWHMVSPHSQGLMHGAIAQSGTAYGPFMILDGSSITYNLADHFNCPINNTSLMMNCLRLLDADAIATAPVTNQPGTAQAFWTAVIEGDFLPVNITDNDLYSFTESPTIPLMAGYLYHDVARSIQYGESFQTLSGLIGSVAARNYRNPEAVAAAAEYVYIDEAAQQDEFVKKMTGIELMNDANFRGPAVKLVEDFAK